LLWNLAFDDGANKVAIAETGGIEPLVLVALARGGTDAQKRNAAGSLRDTED
jgi:hypothetical protein